MTNLKKRLWSFHAWDYSALPPCGFVFSINGVPHVGYPADRGHAVAQDFRELIKIAKHMTANGETAHVSPGISKPHRKKNGGGI
ncbi:hypothetical protein [Serratia marcescens]|uniref:hypothetical protein n=1 Tax=Serratia marcescens TaxID=615 RepID=UPI00403737A1